MTEDVTDGCWLNIETTEADREQNTREEKGFKSNWSKPTNKNRLG